jgi:hypothetical protein
VRLHAHAERFLDLDGDLDVPDRDHGLRLLAATVVDYSEGFDGSVLRANLFAIGVVLFITTAALTIGAKIASASAAKRLGGS